MSGLEQNQKKHRKLEKKINRIFVYKMNFFHTCKKGAFHASHRKRLEMFTEDMRLTCANYSKIM